MITDCEPSYHLAALYHRLSARPYRILYVGLNLALLGYLEDHLKHCWITRAPTGLIARLFIEKLKHSLLLFDEELPDTTGQALARFAKKSAYKGCPPILIVKKSDNLNLMLITIGRLLAKPH